jgi:hypothetical protein
MAENFSDLCQLPDSSVGANQLFGFDSLIVARFMTREQLIEIARLCVRQACATTTKDVAAVLWRMAQEYLDKAAKLEKNTATR